MIHSMNTYNNTTYSEEMTHLQFVFAHFSLYILFPLLYIIISTGDITPIMTVWKFIQSGMFDAYGKLKERLTDIVYATLRAFGQYTFSTYTVVRNGREIYTASSMCFFRQSDICSVYRIDRAKYNVCKWIDRQCKQYKLENNGEHPELTETHNDIYDFILHKVDDGPYTRIHRGDFSGKTHTLSTIHYREFSKSYQMADTAIVTVCTLSSEPEPEPETFTISLKSPHHFFIEKNEFLDKKFLQWKLYNECGRKDVADYIGAPHTNYKVVLCYCMAENTMNPLYQLNDSHSILIGNKYIVKVDSVLRCPVLESGEQQVFDIDGILSSYYDCSDSESSEDSEDSESDIDSGIEEVEVEEVDADADADDPEFEIIEGEGEGERSE